MSNLNLVFNFQGNSITMQCNSSEKLIDVYTRLCSKIGKNLSDCSFYRNAKEVPPCNKTLENLQITNFNSFVVVLKNIIGA